VVVSFVRFYSMDLRVLKVNIHNGIRGYNVNINAPKLMVRGDVNI